MRKSASNDVLFRTVHDATNGHGRSTPHGNNRLERRAHVVEITRRRIQRREDVE